MPSVADRVARTDGGGQSPLSARVRESVLGEKWERQAFRRNGLTDTTGRAVRIVYRGRRGRGPGPDYRDAIVSFDGDVRQGDIELHVRTSDFRGHRHRGDPAYQRVVLHVVCLDDEGVDTDLGGGLTAPVVAIGLPRSERDGRRVPIRAAYSEPCQSAVARLGHDEVGAALERLGDMRFRQKCAAWRKRLAAGETPEDALWSGVLEALSYGGYREAMRRLAAALPWHHVAKTVCRGPGAAERSLNQALRRIAPHGKTATRPGNNLERRVGAAGALAERFVRVGGIGSALLEPLDTDKPDQSLISVLTVRDLIGRARAIEIAANVVLPLAAALCSWPSPGGAIDYTTARRFEGVFATLPAPARYGSVRHLHTALGGVHADMRRQQGMLYLLGQYCSQGGCGRCPLS